MITVDGHQLTTFGVVLTMWLSLLGYLRVMKNDLRDEIREVGSRMIERIDGMRADSDVLRSELVERIDGAEERLGRQLEGLDRRLVTIEARTYDIGRMLPPPTPQAS